VKCKLIFFVGIFSCAALVAAEKKPSMPDVPRKIERLTLKNAWELAEKLQPQIAEAKALVDAAEGRTKQAGTFPNPEAIVRAESVPLDGNGSGEYLVGVAQSIPINGSLSKTRKVEALDRDRLKIELEAKRRDVRKRVQSDFATALYQSKAYETLTGVSEQMNKAVSIAKARVEAGDALPSDLGRIEMEAVRVQTELRKATALRDHAFVALALSIGDPKLELKSLDGTLEAAFEIPALESLATDLMAHPASVAAAGEIEVRRARLDLAKAQRIPNINVEALYRRDQNNKRDGVDIGLSFPLPVFNRNTGRVQEAKAELAASEARSRSRRNELAFTLHEGETHLTAALDNARLSKNEILPRAEEILKVAEERYRNGDMSLAEVIPVRRDWAESNLAYLESLRDVMLAWADLSEFIKTN
jgi:outer membrane protein, heavy metal efflux system